MQNHWKGRFVSSSNGNYILTSNGNIVLCFEKKCSHETKTQDQSESKV